MDKTSVRTKSGAKDTQQISHFSIKNKKAPHPIGIWRFKNILVGLIVQTMR
jgi:hypothetical protein